MNKQKKISSQTFENKTQAIGEILLERGLVNPGQLQQGLAAQKKQGGLLGENLIRLGFIGDIDLVVALVLQCGIPYIAVDNYDPDPEIAGLIPQDFARKERLVALNRAGAVLSVVMADPVNTGVVKDLERMTGYRIVKFIATPSQINRAISKAYGT